ncbi:MAG: hypothetical protein ACJ72W_09355 [Actinoallomurus sp.]
MITDATAVNLSLLGTPGAGGRLAVSMAGAGRAFLAGALVVVIAVRGRPGR